MNIKETLTVDLDRDLVEQAIKDFLYEKGYVTRKIEFDLQEASSLSIVKLTRFNGAKVTVEKRNNQNG